MGREGWFRGRGGGGGGANLLLPVPCGAVGVMGCREVISSTLYSTKMHVVYPTKVNL